MDSFAYDPDVSEQARTVNETYIGEKAFPRRICSQNIKCLTREFSTETPLEMLEKVQLLKQGNDIEHGTRRAIKAGLKMFKDLRIMGNHYSKACFETALEKCHGIRAKPAGHFDNFNATLWAVSDFTCTLEAKQVYIKTDGVPILGNFAVWRHPVLGPWDMDIWEGVPYPNDVNELPDNCIMISRRGDHPPPSKDINF